ncbi:bifunctional diguanylate cyclase/phosphodiesterase [Microvirga splendida]|uniref:EAL domain-containing protein n=1 Tax=Microvirga splendida TaxID=2795727 RepID=A0ABS0XVI2_9HYPH|nr:EAL domain-containing protein [Microvirga splendida]MBJ6124042.1 EAL domain-containing protein [Microvirga splendida]
MKRRSASEPNSPSVGARQPAGRDRDWKAIAEIIPQMVWLAQPDGGNDYYSGRWYEFTGVPVGVAHEDGWREVAHPDDRSRVEARWEHSVTTGEKFETEYRIRHRSGEYRWILSQAAPSYDDHGRIERWFGTSTDIHAAKMTEAALARSEEQYRALLEVSAGVVWLATPDGMITEARGWKDFTGQDEDKAVGLGTLNVVHLDDRERTRQAWLAAVASAVPYQHECRVWHASGEYRWTLNSAVPIKNPDGSIREWIGTLSDIHERKQAEEQLRASEERLRLALQVGRMSAWELDLETGEISSAKNLPDLLGHSPRSLSGFLERVHPDDLHKREAFFREIAAQGASSIELRYLLPSNQVQWVGIRAEKRGPSQIVGVTFDISERKAAEEEIWRAANHDPLTGLPNRALFQQRLEQALAEAKRSETSVSFLMLDLDEFKVINDLLGHDAGDAVLREVASRLEGITRQCDTVARFGGDEFGIILVEPMRLEHSIRYAERVIKRLRQPFSYTGRKLIIKGSIGVTAFPDHHADPMALMKAADIALYRAKAQGRNRVVVYTSEMGQDIEDQAALRQQVRKALLREQFLPHYQPKIDLASGRIVGFEALARWENPSRGILTPAAFSAAFADPELGVALGKQIISRAAQDMRQWLDNGIDFGRVAVNLSSAEFNRPHLAEEVLSLLDAAKVPPERLEVEITETVLLGRSAEYAGTILRTLCERGVRIALDDFGTGYASLTHLKQFPVDHVKIDRSFVRDLEEDADDAAIVAAVISLGHSLNLAITAEGVETPGQALRLRALGCHHAQGFLYSQAVTASEVPEFIASWSNWETKSSG